MKNNNGKIIKFPGGKDTPRSSLEEALKESDDMKGSITIGLFEKEENGEILQRVEYYIGGKKDFNDTDILWLIKRLEFELLHLAKDFEEDQLE